MWKWPVRCYGKSQHFKQISEILLAEWTGKVPPSLDFILGVKGGCERHFSNSANEPRTAVSIALHFLFCFLLSSFLPLPLLSLFLSFLFFWYLFRISSCFSCSSSSHPSLLFSLFITHFLSLPYLNTVPSSSVNSINDQYKFYFIMNIWLLFAQYLT